MQRLLLILLLLPSFCFGQNLVPNPSFEQLDTCPYTLTVISYATPWTSANSQSSSDVYHACGTPPLIFGVPTNLFGYQVANTGDAYAGIICYSSLLVDYREYIEVRLTDSLKKDSLYRVSFYHNLVDQARWSINRIGAALTVDSLWKIGVKPPFTNTPAVENDSTIMLNDTVNWVLITGTYLAQGGERYITIGNFYYDSSTTIQQHFGGDMNAYYYIDDVSVTLESEGGGEGIDELDQNSLIHIYPNPSTGLFTVQGTVTEIQVYDLFGRLVLETPNKEIDMGSYPAGIYMVRVGEAVRKLILH